MYRQTRAAVIRHASDHILQSKWRKIGFDLKVGTSESQRNIFYIFSQSFHLMLKAHFLFSPERGCQEWFVDLSVHFVL